MWFIRRFPARESRWRFCSPEDASSGAVPVNPGEAVAISEPRHVADVGQDAGRHDGPDAVDVHQRGTASEHDGFELGGGLLDLRLHRDQFGELVGGDASTGLPGDVTRADRGQHGLGLAGGDVAFGLSWKEFSQQSLESVDRLDSATGECFATVGEHPKRLSSPSTCSTRKVVVRTATIAIE